MTAVVEPSDLTVGELAALVERLANNVRSQGVENRRAILLEVASRLVTPSDPGSELEKFKDRVRDRAIKEADRRDWCGEFDGILEELGMRGRFGNFAVTFIRTALSQPDTRCVIARDEDHARKLVSNSWRYDQGFEIISVTLQPRP